MQMKNNIQPEFFIGEIVQNLEFQSAEVEKCWHDIIFIYSYI